MSASTAVVCSLRAKTITPTTRAVTATAASTFSVTSAAPRAPPTSTGADERCSVIVCICLPPALDDRSDGARDPPRSVQAHYAT